MISGVAFLCTHAQIRNTVEPQISIGLMVRSNTMCGKQQHVPSSTENSGDGNSSACCIVSFRFGLTLKHLLIFPGCHWSEPWTRAEKKCSAFFCVCVTSLLCRWCSETRHTVWYPSGVLRWEKSNSLPKLLKVSQNSRRTERKRWAFTGLPVERINLTLRCHAHCMESFSPLQCVTPFFTTVCRIFWRAKVQCFQSWVFLNSFRLWLTFSNASGSAGISTSKCPLQQKCTPDWWSKLLLAVQLCPSQILSVRDPTKAMRNWGW